MINSFLDRFKKPHLSADRKTMELALKGQCIPVIRKQGFKGSFPNFYREDEGFVALVNFQFISSGGSFCVNLAYTNPERSNIHPQSNTAAKNIRIYSINLNDRCRMGSVNGEDPWFCFGKTNYGMFRSKPIPVKDIALKCSQLFLSEAENWWLEKKNI
ncbi:DUF4304 domain-containing protein [Amylibacter sp. SFDW26]|uniref:DUF4304 domain-containing protein n=1 Tax=Amylibacter sp. SFDW26 TaxID=2652722 RepID=UPI0018697D07|nr:DUF4304 domain-containing protein [Amylibacter sp. SFDW26]